MTSPQSPDHAKALPIEQVVNDRIRRELLRCREELGVARRVLRAIQSALKSLNSLLGRREGEET